ncbi:TRZ/ATZ family hydrolase [Candidatus Venteria ishoeyi]|uniref:5-methylthioadenosine/S-adenosylhomocysteine deaminase n=1 Tax=Candidatus Venteria ishoeyi TaxID=1899563 RepID=A0A1H6FE96_9GAMM|nr:TRZ/ATZ family hydrolase [Candidatus Venteria ishoeyi]SEH07731.1 5-methylthioadenosine/S-adenosylhomocysteine deaminase [Candidatus Venteria ishoeyi]
MRHIDSLIFAGWVIPGEPEDRILEKHALAIHEGKIVTILPIEEAVREFSARVTHRLPQHALIPGLINTHTHAAMTLLRGYGSDLPMMEWLHEHIWPAEQAWMSDSFVADGTRLAVAEMLTAGITCFNDMYFFPETTASVVEELGIRACIGLIVVDFPTIWAKNPGEYLGKAEGLYKHYRQHSLIRTALAPHAPYSVSDDPLKSIAALSESWDIPIHMHLHETADEVVQSQKQYQLRPIERLENLGLLSERFLAVHATQLNDNDIEYLQLHQCHVVHCPESNLKLASGFCPVPRLLENGINVALGTDGAASNDDLDILGEMRTAALLAKGISGNAAAVPAAKALHMATLGGAQALGIDDITGSLKPGKAADVVAIDMSALSTQPVYNVLSQIVYAASRHQVTDVWVAGQHLLKSRILSTMDMRELQTRILFWRQKIGDDS